MSKNCIARVTELMLCCVPSSQMAFAKQKSTGRVDDSKVYLSGHYFIGPDYTFKTFRADAHFAQLDDISTFTTDNFEMSFSCSFQYFLRPEDLKELHENYNLFYGPVVKSTAIAAAKRQGSLLSIDQFLKHRAVVEQAMLDEIRVSSKFVIHREVVGVCH